jgi:hypothetical protein
LRVCPANRKAETTRHPIKLPSGCARRSPWLSTAGPTRGSTPADGA